MGCVGLEFESRRSHSTLLAVPGPVPRKLFNPRYDDDTARLTFGVALGACDPGDVEPDNETGYGNICYSLI